jgi:pimeloyl-ACP methyl ester carboxylesterase
MARRVLLGLFVLAIIAGGGILLRYMGELSEIRERLSGDSRMAETPFGAIEYTTWGEGPTALMIHGAGGGYDQGRLMAEHFVGEGFSWLAVSRFGYLRSPLPEDASTAAQADAIAALMDQQGLSRAAVVGVSGGVPPALQLAIRHPEKVSALVLASSAPFTPLDAGAQDLPLPAWVYQALFSIDFPYWVLTKIAPDRLLGIYDATPALMELAGPGDAAFARAMVDAFLPVTLRVEGTRNEGAAIDPGAPTPIDRITAPALVVHARDDGINPYPIARYLARTLPQAEAVTFDDGGHMLLGHSDEVRTAIRDFLARHGPGQPPAPSSQ